MGRTKVRRKRRAQSCPLCHAELRESDTVARCEGCETLYHLACLRELGGCATLGCAMNNAPGVSTGSPPPHAAAPNPPPAADPNAPPTLDPGEDVVAQRREAMRGRLRSGRRGWGLFEGGLTWAVKNWWFVLLMLAFFGLAFAEIWENGFEFDDDP